MGGKRSRNKRNDRGKGKGKGKDKGQDADSANEASDGGDDSWADGAANQGPAKRSKKGGDAAWRDPPEDFELKNANYEAYYLRQQVCPEDQWESLLESLRTGLPTAIRINKMRAGAEAVGARLVELRDSCSGDAERECYSPKQLLWYPHGLAWHWPSLARRTIKKDRRHVQLKNYLAQREMRGLISRQEVVSMIPPLFLGVEPQHWVLDLCAAPGSKTSQMLEIMHWPHTSDPQAGLPTGLVLANELSWRRANVLAHQVNRIGSPCTAVVNMDAQFFPELWGPTEDDQREICRFDRVLCDVPCSGDGTMRKTPYIWKSWSQKDGLALHIRQLGILSRGLDLLKVGGRLVYSTCSLNPIEDEAVVAAALKRHGDAIVLVPPPEEVGSGLKAGSGLDKWVVPHPQKDGEFFESFSDVPAELKDCKLKLMSTMFPPCQGLDPAAAERWATERQHCRRMLPHLMDTGGFFIAVFEKRSTLPPSAKARREARRDQRHSTQEPQQDVPSEDVDAKLEATVEAAKPPPQELKLLSREYVSAAQSLEAGEWNEVAKFYGLDETKPGRFVMRAKGDKHIFFISEANERLLKMQTKLPTRMVYCGVLAFHLSGSHHEKASPWRLAQEGLPALCSFGMGRRIHARRDFLRQLLAERELTVRELRAAAAAGLVLGLEAVTDAAGELRPGSLAVALLADDSDKAALPPVALAANLSDDGIELQGNSSDLVALMEDLTGQPSVEDILGAAGETEGVEEEEAEENEAL